MRNAYKCSKEKEQSDMCECRTWSRERVPSMGTTVLPRSEANAKRNLSAVLILETSWRLLGRSDLIDIKDIGINIQYHLQDMWREVPLLTTLTAPIGFRTLEYFGLVLGESGSSPSRTSSLEATPGRDTELGPS